MLLCRRSETPRSSGLCQSEQKAKRRNGSNVYTRWKWFKRENNFFLYSSLITLSLLFILVPFKSFSSACINYFRFFALISVLFVGDRTRAWFPSFVSCLDHYSPRIQEVERQSSFITFDSEKINFPTNYHANFSVRLLSSASDKKRSANLQRDALSTLPLLRVYVRPFSPRLPNERIRFSLPFVILPLRHLSYNHRYSIYNSVLRTRYFIQSRS